jgi:cytochrome d ubiquinol oxidase subunit II
MAPAGAPHLLREPFVTERLLQGIALGALVQGVKVADRAYAGGWWDWLSVFSILTGFAVVIGYALLGATWIILKTEGKLQQQMQKHGWWLGAG